MAGTVQPPTPRGTPAPARDPWIDNGRLLAAVLVVSIHMVELHLQRQSFAEWFWVVTWAIRLPLFGIIAGLFSRHDPRDRDFRELIRSVLLPLVIMTTVHLLVDAAIGIQVVIRPEVPVYTLWFLYGLILWRVALPYVARLRRPMFWVTLASVLIGLPVFFQADWALGPIVAHFPFFVAGWKLKPHLARLRHRTMRSTLIAASLLATSIATLTLLLRYSNFGIGELTMNLVYAEETLSLLHSMLTRLLVVATGVVIALAGLHLIPRRHLPLISNAGARGFTIYLLHGVVIRVSRELGLLPTENLTQWQVPILLGLSVLLAFGLGSQLVARITRPLMRPKAKWLFRAEAANTRGTSLDDIPDLATRETDTGLGLPGDQPPNKDR